MFISYAWEDGKSSAVASASALRGLGVPVWFDEHDLRAGRIDTTIRSAASDGLAGAVLVASPGVERSAMIQTVEGPLWQDLLEDSRFILAIVNQSEDPEGPDYRLPDQVLPGPGARLAHYKQYPTVDEDWLETLVRDIASARLRLLSTIDPTDALAIVVDSRSEIHARRSSGHLLATLDPPSTGSSVPSAECIAQLRRLTRLLPRLVSEMGRQRVVVGGGMHLSVAVSLGAALVGPTGISMAFDDQYGHRWTSESSSTDGIPLMAESKPDVGPVAAFVDLVGSAPLDDAFTRDLAHSNDMDRPSIHIYPEERGDISPSAGESTAAEVAKMIKAFASECQTLEVHLALRTPAALAALLGRHLNTMRVHLYEWERARTPPTYLPFATLTPGGIAGEVLE